MKKLQLLGLLTILTLPLIFQLTPLEILKLKVFDSLVKEQEPSGFFTTLDITEEDVQREGGWPFPRKRLAEIHMDLLHRGAMGVGYVIAFSEPDRFGGDEDFANVLKLYPSVIAMFETNNKQYPQTTGTVILGDDIGGVMLQGSTQNIKVLRESAYQGISSAPIDVDGLTRRLPLLMRTPEGWTPAFGTQILKVLAGTDTYVIKTNDNGLEEIRAKGIPPISVDSLGRKWISWVDTPSTTLQEMNVKDKFVIVGVTANGVMPQLSTPDGLKNPHHIQASLAESILIQDSPYIPDYALALELLLLSISVALIWAVLNLFGITLGISSVFIIMVSIGIYGYWTAQQGILIDVTWTLISQFITATTAFYLRFREQYKLRQLIKQQFGKYLDPRMVKKLQLNPELCQVNGTRVDCSIIFTDLRGFTSLSESVEPEMVTYIMNNVLDAQVKAVNKFYGVTDKFIGDAGMFHFNTIIPQPDHHNLVLAAAQEIQKNIKELNVTFKEEGIPEIAIGIGVNSGVCIAGNFGATDRFAFSLIGDPCNVAARLESGTKEVGVDVLIGYNTAIKSDYELKLLEPLQVKGKKEPLNIYTWDN